MKIAWEESPITNTNKSFNESMDDFEQAYEKKNVVKKIQTLIPMKLERLSQVKGEWIG